MARLVRHLGSLRLVLPRWWEVVLLLGMVSLVVVLAWDCGGGTDRVRSTRTRLFWNRGLIQEFLNSQGRYPVSLAELADYRNKDTVAGRHVLLEEWLSDRNGLAKESSSLDGTGGWYYDMRTGELRVNLTQPLKRYAPFYWGSDRNKAPATW